MSTQTLWIVVAVVVAVLLIAVVLGLVIGRRRRISLRERDEQANLETGEKAPPKGGTYQAGGGFNFASGTATAPERPTAPPPGVAAPKDATPPEVPSEKAPKDTSEGSDGGGSGRGTAVAGAAGAAVVGGAAVAGSAATAPERERTTETPAPEKAAPEKAAPPEGRTTEIPSPTAGDAGTTDTATAAPAAGTPGTVDPVTGEPVTTDTANDVRTPPRGMSIPDGATEARTPPSGISIVDAPTPPQGTPVVPDSRVIDTEEAGKDPATQQIDTRSATAPAEPDVRDTPATTDPGTGTTGTGTTGTGTTGTGTTGAGTMAAGGAVVAGTAAVAGAAATTAPSDAAPSDAAPSDTAPADALTEVAASPVAPAAPAEDIPSADGRLNRLRGRLSRSRSGLGQSLLGLLGAGQMDEESWEDVEATLLQADLGPEMTTEITDKLREQLAARAVRTSEGARAVLHDTLTEALDTNQDRSVRVLPHDGRPAVVLVVGVNGTGKTTTTGKLARVLVGSGHTVTLGAADTFRAAAAEQLVTWGERSGASVVRGPEGSDPAAVAFDAVKRGTEDGVDAVLLDTAGRLHTKTGLMDELGKVKRVVEKQAEVDEVLLVLDATTGQNGLTQARVFGDVVKVTGIALTKLDGTAKGGIVFRVQRELGVPVKLVGLGEGPDDLAPFEPKAFVDALLD